MIIFTSIGFHEYLAEPSILNNVISSTKHYKKYWLPRKIEKNNIHGAWNIHADILTSLSAKTSASTVMSRASFYLNPGMDK